MKFKFVTVNTEYHNDCWAIALSKALDVDYKEIRKQFKHMIDTDNSVESGIIKGYLKQKGYTVIPSTNSLKNALRLFNLTNGILFAIENEDEKHIVYIKGNKIYEGDTCTEDMMWWYIERYKLMWLAIKMEDYE